MGALNEIKVGMDDAISRENPNMTETAMAAALKRAGHKKDRGELWRLACEMLKLADVEACKRMLEQASADMNLPGKGRARNETRAEDAQPRQREEGHSTLEAQNGSAPSRTPKAMSEATRTSRASAAKALASSFLRTYKFPNGPAYLETRVVDLKGLALRLSKDGGDRLHAAMIASITLKTIESRGQVTNPKAVIKDVLDSESIKMIEMMTDRSELSFRVREWASRNMIDNTIAAGAS